MNHQYHRTGLSSRLRQLALAALFATGAATSAHAQFGYSATSTSNIAGGASAYVDLGTTGTAIATANTDDANSAAQNIGFTFNYNGAAFTQFVLNTNGFIKLGATAPTGAQYTDGANSTANGPFNSTDTNLIVPFNQDLTAGSAGGTEYRVVTTGTAPNRVCTIQWKNISDKARLAGTTTIATQYANFSFQVKLYETSNQIDFVYGTATAGAVAGDNPKFMGVGIKGTDGAAANAIVGTKASVSPWSGTIFSGGAYAASGVNGHNIRGTVLPDPGRTYRFTIQVANDAAATNIQGYGSMAVPAGNPFAIRGVVNNAGNTALGAIPVTLTISGANTYTQTVNATAMAVGGTTTVNFPGISLANVGTNTVTISVPSDGNNNNNSFSQTMVTSATDFSFIAPGVPQTSSYGFTPSTGFTSAFCAKFTVSAARSVTAVRAVIGNDANLVPNATNGQRSTVVFGVVINATTGAILGRSPDYTLVAADLGQLHTFTLSAATTVPAGDFLVGLAQVVPAGTAADAVFPMAYQAEVPARTGLFFSSGVSSPSTPNDASANNARYMLEAVTAAPANNDAAVTEIQGYGSLAVPSSNPSSMRAVITNGGAAALTNVVVTLNITGANTVTLTQTVPSIAVGGSTQVTFSGINLTAVGTNTVTVSVPNDDNLTNNTKTQTLATSATRFSFITPGVPQSSSFGFTPGTAARTLAFCGKFTVNTPRDVTAVRAVIGNDPTLVSTPTTVYGVLLNATTGAVIARSPDYLITTADLGQLHTFTLSGSVAAGDFLVGLAQVLPIGTAANQVFPMAYQAETPARTGTFFTANITTPAAPTDAAANNARFMLEAETAAPATCPVPTALALTAITSTTASFSFTAAVTGATGYQIIYGPQGFTPGGTGSQTSATFTGTTYTLGSLSPSTNYDFYVRTICGATDQSAPAGPVRGTTACTPPVINAFPYTQNFDVVSTGQTLPCGISVLDANNDGFTWRATGTVDGSLATGNISRSGPNAMVYSYNSTDTTVPANDWFFGPALTLTNTQRYRVAFYYRAAAGYPEGLEVKYGTAATPAGQTTTIYTNNNIGNTTYQLANNTTTPVVADITPAAGTYYLGFHAISTANQGFLAVDDLVITAGPLATSEALKRAVSVFPNPSNTGAFNLEIHGANAKSAMGVEVTNMLGQVVYTGTAKDNFRNTVDLSTLAGGIYTIKVRNGAEYTQQQISIVK
ncbi:beta strand repeat-containing protein [Hymenobacter daeguensis]